MIQGIKATDQAKWIDQAENAIRTSVIPGYRLLLDYFNNLLPNAPRQDGIWQFKGGLDYYSYLLQHYTSTDLTSDEIHKLGLGYVDQVSAEIRQLFSNLNYPQGETIPTLMKRMAEESGYVSGSEAEAAYRSAIHLAQGILDQAFDLKPDSELKIIAGDQGNFYTPPPLDKSRPGLFYAATTSPQPAYQVPTIGFHETIPGHHLQIATSYDLNIPLMQMNSQINAYVEGWALYAEHLMWELGAYKDDPFGNLGRLKLELLRAVRLVVDTGIHGQKWTYEQASKYMLDTIGEDFEIYRYMVYPGQATAYYIGYMKIMELRKRVKETLGDRFNLKGFHHAVLGHGPLPLKILDKVMDLYINQAKT